VMARRGRRPRHDDIVKAGTLVKIDAARRLALRAALMQPFSRKELRELATLPQELQEIVRRAFGSGSRYLSAGAMKALGGTEMPRDLLIKLINEPDFNRKGTGREVHQAGSRSSR
jgi:hypothetical protein